MISAAAILMLSSMLYSLRLSSGSFPKPLSAKEEQEYLEKAAAGDLEARNILIERNLRLVAHIMKKYYAQTSDQEDLISIGTIGLIKAVSTFDAGKGIRLATYAARCVENEILMHFRSQRKSASDVSLSDYIETGKDGTALSLMDVVCQDDDMFDRISSREDVRLLRQYMGEVLDDREQKVLTLRYGLDGKEPLPQREVAQQCNISRSYISRIEKKRWRSSEAPLKESGRMDEGKNSRSSFLGKVWLSLISLPDFAKPQKRSSRWFPSWQTSQVLPKRGVEADPRVHRHGNERVFAVRLCPVKRTQPANWA